MTAPLFLDLETQSAVDIRRQGARSYIRHSSTRVLCAAFMRDGALTVWIPPGRCPAWFVPDLTNVNDGDATFWAGEDPPPCVVRAALDGAPFVAHNADSFDAPVWESLYPQRPRWVDTIHLCRAAGYPGGLDAVTKALGLSGKDDSGGRAMKMLCRATVGASGDTIYPVGTASAWQALIQYNVRDTMLLKRVWEETRDYGEPDVIDLTRTINRRGCPVDLGFARRVEDMWIAHQRGAATRVAELSEGDLDPDDVRSHVKIKAWLKSRGCDVKSLERKAIEEMLSDPDGFFGSEENELSCRIRELLVARQCAVRATAAKVHRVFEAADADSRCRDWCVYHGAHTGRFSARGLQPHNMARGADIDMGAVLLAHEEGRLGIDTVRAAARVFRLDDALATLMRPIVRAPRGKRLVVVDYAQVEGRALAWLTQDSRMLAVYRDLGKDIYCDAASEIYGERVKKDDARRQLGKIAVLACGYQMGPEKFAATCRGYGVDLSAAGVTPAACVNAFRSAYPGVRQYWYALDRAAVSAVETGRTARHNGCGFRKRGSWLEITLPSGRCIRFADAKLVEGKYGPQISYAGRHCRKYLYGGLLTENVDQGMCRDLLVDAMLRVDTVYPVVLHVHDEIVFEVPADVSGRALREICSAMSIPPTWAEGFPLRVFGFVADHYTKIPLPDAPTAEYFLGKPLDVPVL